MNNKMKVVSGIMVAAMATLTVNLIGSKDVHANAGNGFDRGGNIFGTSELLSEDFSIDEILCIADFNNDGFDDLVAYGGSPCCNIWLCMNQQGNGWIKTWQIAHEPGFNWYGWEAMDVNGDGYLDLVNARNLNVLVYINQLGSGLACNTDLNDDGTVNITDLLFVMSTWGDCS